MSFSSSDDLPRLIKVRLRDGSEAELANLPDCDLGHRMLREIVRRFPQDRLFTTFSTRICIDRIRSIETHASNDRAHTEMPIDRFLIDEVRDETFIEPPSGERAFPRLHVRLRASVRGYNIVGLENLAVTASGNGFAVIQKLYNDARGQKKFFFTTDWGQFPLSDIDIGSLSDPDLNPLSPE